MGNLTTIAFDADDTLWHNERYFRLTQDHFKSLLKDYADPDHLDERLLDAEKRNISYYGFGIKGFTLSMIETAVEITDAKVPASVLKEIIDTGRDMLRHPVDLLPHARDAVEYAAEHHHVILITKGDLLDQERKLAQSGLGEMFDQVEIVSEKVQATYARIFDDPSTALMVGNSLKSDVIPALQAGAHGLYVPHGITWALEYAEEPSHPRYHKLPNLALLKDLIESL